jgi:glycosyltransferase involved in cell wall biosynthesis
MGVLSAPLPRGRLVVFGEGKERTSLLRLARQLAVSDRVLFAGTELQPQAMLAVGDVYISTPLKEGGGISLLEAAACGLPVVSWKVEAVEETLPEESGALLAPMGELNRLAELVLMLYRHRKMASGLGSRLRRYVARTFSYAAFVNAYGCLFEKLIAERMKQELS